MSDAGPASPVRRRRILVTDRGILLALLLVAIAWIASLLGPVILASVGALILVGTLNPLVGFLQSRGLRRTSALIVIFLAMAGILVLIGLLTVPALIAQVRQLIDGAPAMQHRLAERLSRSHLTMPMARAVEETNLQDLLIPSGARPSNTPRSW